jgi:5'-nucleotidase
MKRILVDMDGVIADVYTRFIELHEQETGIRKSMDELIGIKEGESFPEVYRWIEHNHFFRTLPVMPDSQKILKLMNERYEIIIVSMATEYPTSLTDKQLWLNENFPFINWKQIVFCGNKSLIPADIMIDDHFKNLDYFTGEAIMYLQPHNINDTSHNYRKVASWKEIGSLFLG